MESLSQPFGDGNRAQGGTRLPWGALGRDSPGAATRHQTVQDTQGGRDSALSFPSCKEILHLFPLLPWESFLWVKPLFESPHNNILQWARLKEKLRGEKKK